MNDLKKQIKIIENHKFELLKYPIVPDSKRITEKALTKYEAVRLLAIRTTHISEGAEPMVDVPDDMDPLDVAILEILHKVIPLIILRPLPNGKYERWKITDFTEINENFFKYQNKLLRNLSWASSSTHTSCLWLVLLATSVRFAHDVDDDFYESKKREK